MGILRRDGHSADLLHQLDDDPLRAADIAEPIDVLVVLHLANPCTGATSSQSCITNRTVLPSPFSRWSSSNMSADVAVSRFPVSSSRQALG